MVPPLFLSYETGVKVRKERIQAMTGTELDDYAAVLGIDVRACKTDEAKAAKIIEARERVATITVFGTEFHVPIRKFRDKRIQDRINKTKTDAALEKLMKDILGEQYGSLIDLCTDEDGGIDIDAYALIINRILTAPELKNY